MVGQDAVVTTLKNAIRRQALTHAYLFSGPRGTGKTSLARIIAKAINCLALRDGFEPCNACSICKDVNQGRLVDLIEIDAASNRGIDEIRELREKILFAPTHARSKVYIIDEVHMLTKEAFNALLKTLEEPPEHAYFILATTEAHKIPETIVSRCQQFLFKRIDAASIQKQLEFIASQEKITAEAEALALIARMANGGLRDAIGLFEQMNLDAHVRYEQVALNLGLAGGMMVQSFFEALRDRQALRALEVINQVNNQGKNLDQFAGEFIHFLREQMLISLDNPQNLERVLRLIETFSEAKRGIHQALIPQLPLEVAVLKTCALEGMAAPEAVKKETFFARAPEKEKTAAPSAKGGSSPGGKEEVAEDSGELTLEGMKGQWSRVIQAIETPFIRVSFADAEPIRFEKGDLHLEFKSRSMMEKIESKTNQAQVQSAFQAIFNRKIKLKMEMKKVNLKPIATPADMAKEVFGS